MQLTRHEIKQGLFVSMFALSLLASIVLLRTSPPTSSILAIGAFPLIVGALGLAIDARLRLAEARRIAGQEHARAEEALAFTQQLAADLALCNEEQQRLRDRASALEVPAIELADRVLLVPLIGDLDSRRVDDLTERLFHISNEQRARIMILDIAGVTAVAPGVPAMLTRTALSLRLQGCRIAITGISPAMAATIAQLRKSLPDIVTARSPRDLFVRIIPGTGMMTQSQNL